MPDPPLAPDIDGFCEDPPPPPPPVFAVPARGVLPPGRPP